MTAERVIGSHGKLPWRLPEELRLFRELTLGGTLIMGRKTYQSLNGPLPERNNLVLSNSLEAEPGITICRNWEDATEIARRLGRPIWAIGGASVYQAALPEARQLVISWVDTSYVGDVRFPEVKQADWELVEQQQHAGFVQEFYRRRTQKSPVAMATTGLIYAPTDRQTQ